MSAGRDRHAAQQATQQRRAASSGLLTAEGRQIHAPLRAGTRARAGRARRPARNGNRRRRRRRRPPHRPSDAAAPASVGTSRPRVCRHCCRRGHRARPCAGGRPGPRSSARHARGAATGDGSGRWSPTPWRSPNRRQALGASTATQRSTTRTSRITIVTPRRPTFALAKTLVNWALQVVDGGEMRSADLVDTSPLPLVCTRTDRVESSAFSPVALFVASAATSAARLHHRPSVHPTVTGTSKHAETCSDVTTSDRAAGGHERAASDQGHRG